MTFRAQNAVQGAGAVTLVTTAETIVLTSGPISTSDASEQVYISGVATITGGTGTTAATCRIRQGTTLTGTVVSAANPETLAGTNIVERMVDALVTPGEVAGQQYVLTVQLTGATANGSVVDSSLSVLSPST